MSLSFDLDFDLPLVFIDTHYNISNPPELEAFTRESNKLYKETMNKRPFECLTRKDVQENLKKEKKDLVAMKRKCKLTSKKNSEFDIKVKTQGKQIQAQRFVMNNLRHGIEYLKEHCSRDKSDGKTYLCQPHKGVFSNLYTYLCNPK